MIYWFLMVPFLLEEMSQMGKVEWTADLSVGIGVIDEQHKMLIEHLNNLTKAIEEQHGPLQVGKVLGFLLEYTDFHFSEEEQFMDANHYPDLDAHKLSHQHFKMILCDLERDFRDDGPTYQLAEAIDTLLLNWLLKHISEVDVEFAAFLKETGSGLAEQV